MTEPRRLRLESNPEDELARALLRGGRPRTSPTAKNRAVVAATTATAIATTSLSAGGSATGGLVAKVATLTALKWLGTAVVVGAMSVAALHEHAALHERVTANAGRASHSPTAAASAVFAPVPEPEAPKALAPAPETSPPAAPFTSPSASARRPIPTPTPAPPVHEELVVLGRASALLNSGEAAKALSILDAYDARFPHAAMAQEATVLRIESLARMGNAEAARRAGNSFVKENPDTPYAAHIRSVIGTNP
jgi:hypothetical protein